MESTSEVEKHIPSFFQNSCPGNSAEEMRSEEDIAATPVVGECKRKTVVGGFTCCVPGCFSNSVRDTGIECDLYNKRHPSGRYTVTYHVYCSH